MGTIIHSSPGRSMIELREGTGIVSAMITGKKTVPSKQIED
jgi:hypothetical protein